MAAFWLERVRGVNARGWNAVRAVAGAPRGAWAFRMAIFIGLPCGWRADFIDGVFPMRGRIVRLDV